MKTRIALWNGFILLVLDCTQRYGTNHCVEALCNFIDYVPLSFCSQLILGIVQAVDLKLKMDQIEMSDFV